VPEGFSEGMAARQASKMPAPLPEFPGGLCSVVHRELARSPHHGSVFEKGAKMRDPATGRRTPMFIKHCVVALAIATAPSAVCRAADQVYFGDLSWANEVPPAAGSAGTGRAVVIFSPDTKMLRIQATFSGLTSGTVASHIHCCISATPTAPVATTTPYFPGFPTGVTSGTYDNTFDMTLASSYNAAFVTAQGSISAALNAILVGMTNSTAYFNIHTTMYPGGEIRANMHLDTVFANGFE
jgi:hypothetical protein